MNLTEPSLVDDALYVSVLSDGFFSSLWHGQLGECTSSNSAFSKVNSSPKADTFLNSSSPK